MSILNKKQKTAIALAAIQEHPRSIPLYFQHHPEAVALGDRIRDVIRNKQVDITGDPYEVAERAHRLVKRKSGMFTEPGKLESHLREAFDRLSGCGR